MMKSLYFSFILLLLSACVSKMDDSGLDITGIDPNAEMPDVLKVDIEAKSLKDLLSDKSKGAKSKIQFKDKSYKVKISHHKGAYSVIMKGKERFNGMKSFNLLPVQADKVILSLWLNYLAERDQMIFAQSEWLTLKVNEESGQLYHLEEQVTKRVLERNSNREGLIFEFDGTRVKPLNGDDFDVNHLEWAIEYVEDVISGKYDYKSSMNQEAFAKYLAYLDYSGSKYLKEYLYLNPIDLRIEPIMVNHLSNIHKGFHGWAKLMKDAKIQRIYKTVFGQLAEQEESIAKAVWIEVSGITLFNPNLSMSFAFLQSKEDKSNVLIENGSNEAFFKPSILDETKWKIKGTSIRYIGGKKKYTVKEPIIFPSGYTVIIDEGKFDLIDGAYILSLSPVQVKGLDNKTIQIYSSDKTGQGFIVLNAEGSSLLENIHFKHLANPSSLNWTASGSVLFFKSDVSIDQVLFEEDVDGDDMLNIVNAKFKLSNSTFKGTNSDAFDGDFVFGEIKNCKFIDVGNDGIDFSGSVIRAEGISFENIADKAISGGEASSLSLFDIEIKDTELGVASKDASKVVGDNIKMDNVRVDFTVFCKKKEYGVGDVRVLNYVSNNTEMPYLLEEGSFLFINEEQQEHNGDAVRSILYGAEYGKASK